jgi:glucokinase
VKYLIAIDLGATKTIVALMKNDSIIKKLKFHTMNNKNAVIKDILNYIDLISIGIKKEDIHSITIGVPSPVESKKGIVLSACNIKNFKNVNLKDIIEKRFKIKTIVENDVKLQALGEYSQNKVDSLLCISIGTGIGAGLVYKGKLYKGINSALELGHMIIKENGDICGCGNRGCLEAYCSGTAITRRFFNEYKIKLIPSEILKLAKKKNKQTLKFLDETGYYLGVGLINAINLFDPEVIVINGGISNFGQYIIKKAIKTLDNKTITKFKGKIVISKLKEDALFYGAIYLSIKY